MRVNFVKKYFVKHTCVLLNNTFYKAQFRNIHKHFQLHDESTLHKK